MSTKWIVDTIPRRAITMNGLTTPRYDASYLAWNTVAGYDNYDDVRAAVDKLAAEGFPIEHLDIIGSDLKTVERVTGRMSRGRAALLGATNGVWTGLFIGLLLSLFATGASIAATILIGAVIGAATGAAFALAAQSAGGRRGYASLRMTVAAHYDLVARNGFVEQARQALTRKDLAHA